jgi:flagellar biosynthesis/type III secretory pathway protein FliH
LFNQPHSARAATPWQPNAGIAQKLSSRGYATTSWTNDEPQAFADQGFPAKNSGFSAAHYQPTKQPLSKQAQASLALLEGECRNETFGEAKPASVEGTETNEHLPFVMDAYGATRKSKLRVNVDPSVLQRALAQAEMAESLVLSPITSDDTSAEPIVIHPDVPDADDVVLHMDTVEELAEQAPAALPVEPEVPELPAVMGGIAPEEVAQREAEQFAKGLAQAREEAAAHLVIALEEAKAQALAQGIEQGMAQGVQEGMAQGIEQGRTEGHEAGLAQGIEEGRAQAMAEGIEQGAQTAREALAEEMAAQRVVFDAAAAELGALINDPKKFFEPLKRLAVHIAEQVVVGELQTSSKGIERLVQRCLDELDHPVHGAVVLELNPQDKERLQAQGGDFIKGMRLEAMPDMQVGSVRVFANDTVVEDLVVNRLEGLARALLVDVDAWRDTSVLAQDVLEVQAEETVAETETAAEEEVEDADVHS